MSTPSDSRTGRGTALLRYLNTEGRPEIVSVREGRWLAVSDGLPSVRELANTDGSGGLVRKSVPQPLGDRRPEVYDLLENEARIGVRLARRYAGSYPQELVRLVGYALDAAEPFVLFEPFRGGPVEGTPVDFMIDKLRLFEVSLLQGLLALAEAGVVHGCLTPATVRWDDQAAQIGDFSHATVRGEPRTRAGQPPWAPPEQRAGTGQAHPADDVWAAGAVIYQVATGQPVPSRGGPMLSNRGAALRNLLDGVFASSPTARPDAAELLQRLRSDPAVPGAAPLHDASFDRGLREFDEVIERKRASLAPAEPESPPPAPPPGSHRRRWWPGNGALGLLGVGL